MQQPEERQDLNRSDRTCNHELLYGDITRRIVGAYYSVKSELGLSLPERIYSNALTVALQEAGLRSSREVPYELVFHGVPVGACRADLVVESLVIVETKVVRAIVPAHREQVWHQLAAAGFPLGMILNFGENPGIARVRAADRAL